MKEILFLAHRMPFPPDRGDKIRSCNVLRHLAGRARVHLVAFAEEPADRDPPAAFRAPLASCTIVRRTKRRAIAAIQALIARQPVSLAAFADPAMAKAVKEVLGERQIDEIYVFSGQMAQYLPTSRPRTVMDFVDVDSAKFAGYAKRGPLALRWLMRREARLLGAFERQVAADVDASLFVSDAEAGMFREAGATGRMLVVENGIDATFFDPVLVDPVGEKGPLIVFTGQMDYAPNVAAVVWFARAVLPGVRALHPATRFAIVGRAPTAEVRALASDSVIVTGALEDVRGWLAAASVCVAPLGIARGIQNKVLEAMAMARPVVASVSAAEGIDHNGTIRIADAPADWVETIAALIDAPETAAALGRDARDRVLARYDWDARLAPLDDLLGLAT